VATYVYRCKETDLTYEADFPIGNAPDELNCGCGTPMRRVYLPTAISFRGSGFYRTDNPRTKHVRTGLKVGGNVSQ
jgi:predicted nucleic acid-binding Zn ribbon protein